MSDNSADDRNHHEPRKAGSGKMGKGGHERRLMRAGNVRFPPTRTSDH
jgi:hypothetical protein